MQTKEHEYGPIELADNHTFNKVFLTDISPGNIFTLLPTALQMG